MPAHQATAAAAAHQVVVWKGGPVGRALTPSLRGLRGATRPWPPPFRQPDVEVQQVEEEPGVGQGIGGGALVGCPDAAASLPERFSQARGGADAAAEPPRNAHEGFAGADVRRRDALGPAARRVKLHVGVEVRGVEVADDEADLNTTGGRAATHVRRGAGG